MEHKTGVIAHGDLLDFTFTHKLEDTKLNDWRWIDRATIGSGWFYQKMILGWRRAHTSWASSTCSSFGWLLDDSQIILQSPVVDSLSEDDVSLFVLGTLHRVGYTVYLIFLKCKSVEVYLLVLVKGQWWQCSSWGKGWRKSVVGWWDRAKAEG